jgi:hypothetical protein
MSLVGGYGIKGMKRRSYSVRAASKERRFYRSQFSPAKRGRKPKCPEGQKPDYRKSRNESGCRYKIIPARNSRPLESPGVELMGHRIHVLNEKSAGGKPKGSLYYIQKGPHTSEKIYKKSWNKTLKKAWDERP